jgi:radical SAM protein with 4Fe4S-binding SPASM domain
MRERGVDRPRLSLVFVAMRRNLGELPDVVRLAADWAVPALRVQNLSHSFSDTDPAGAYREIREFAEAEALWQSPSAADSAIFDEARAVAAALGVNLRLPDLDAEPPRPASGPGCDWPWRSAYVRQDGRVQPCCMLMGGDRAILGDLATTSFPAIWRGEGYEAFRAALGTASPPDVCRGCSQYRGVF